MVVRVVLLALALGVVSPGRAEEGGRMAERPAPPAAATVAGEPVPQPVERLARDVAALVGAPLSPLFMLGVLGGHEWWRAGDAARLALPWHARPWFWGSALLLTLLFWLSDKVPALRHALKPLRLYESKLSGAFVALVLVERIARDATRAVEPVVAGAGQLLLPAAWAAEGGPAGGGAAPAIAAALAWLLGLAVVAAVWLLGHALQVVLLLNPFAPLDWLARTGRLVAVGVPFAAAGLSPVLGLAVAAAYALLALVLAGWSFRWMVFGAVFATDLLLGRDQPPGRGGALAFSGKALGGVARRTLGRVVRDGAATAFVYRPWLVLPRRRLALGALQAVGEGFFHAVLLGGGGTVARFAPRHRRRAGELGARLGLPVVDARPGAGLQGALAALRADVAG